MPADGADGANGVMFAPAIAEPEATPDMELDEDPQPGLDLDEDVFFTLPTTKRSACVRNLGSLAKSNVPRTVY